MELRKVLILTFTLLALAQQRASAQRATFGEPCSKLIRCDSKASLTCEDGSCQCVMPEKMVFDGDKGKCVTMAGEKCVYTAVEMSDDTSDSETKRWREELDCVSRASCSSEGYCVCSDGYFENYNGTCEEKHSYGESCSMDSHCKGIFHLVCNINGTCDCNGLTSYDLTQRKCVGKVGSLCTHYPECVVNAECPPKRRVTVSKRRSNNRDYGYYYSSDYYDVEEDVDYSTESCGCKSGFTNIDGQCLVSYGGTCDYHVESKRCLPGMICREGSCSCKYHNVQEYNSSTSTCQSLIGGPCTETEGSCVINAECLVMDRLNQSDIIVSQLSKQCRCKPGFIEVNRSCEIEYGEKCGPSVHGNTKCDSIAPLQCVEGSCQCNSLEYYDNLMKLCRGLEGAVCSTEPENKYFCTDGASCESYRNKLQGIGICVCRKDYVSTFSRKCYGISKDKIMKFWTTTVLPESSVTQSTSFTLDINEDSGEPTTAPSSFVNDVEPATNLNSASSLQESLF